MSEEIFLGVYLEKEFVDMDTLMDKHSLFLQEDEIKKLECIFRFKKESLLILQYCSNFVYGLSPL